VLFHPGAKRELPSRFFAFEQSDAAMEPLVASELSKCARSKLKFVYRNGQNVLRARPTQRKHAPISRTSDPLDRIHPLQFPFLLTRFSWRIRRRSG